MMRKTPKRPRRPKKKPEYNPPPEPAVVEPTIPQKTLYDFLEDKITLSQVKDTNIEVGYLWTGGDVDRFRINVWQKYEPENSVHYVHFIRNSYFIHYNRKTLTITDKTVPPKPSKERPF